MAGLKLEGGVSANLVEVDANANLLANLPGNTAAGASQGGGANAAGFATMQTESDPGAVTGARLVFSPETDDDYRLRMAVENYLDDETFNYAAQNTGKHNYANTTLTAAWAASGLTTNSGSVTTTGSGLAVKTYRLFPILGAGTALYGNIIAGFSAQPQVNATIDFGFFIPGAATPYAPTDGIYFRVSSSGVQGVTNNNGTEVATPVFLNAPGGSTFTYNNNTKYLFTITITERVAKFWINNVLYGSVNVSSSLGQLCSSNTLPFAVRHGHVGAAGGVIQALITDYSVTQGGFIQSDSLSTINQRIFGSYQGLSGGTMGGLTKYTNSANPTAAIPSNTALTANLPSGLGGEAWETFTLAVNTDGILLNYQVPAGTIAVVGKTLKITGVKLSSFVQTVLAGGPMNRTFSLAFGNTAASLATGEAATTKKPRIVLLPELTQTVTAAQAVNTLIAQAAFVSLFPEPIYVNPGEFVAVCVKHIGTVGTSGTIATNIQLIYAWE